MDNEVYGTFGLTQWERWALGGVAARAYQGDRITAVRRAVHDGIDPDALAAALFTVHVAKAPSTSAAIPVTVAPIQESLAISA